jgi:tight adherence protein B
MVTVAHDWSGAALALALAVGCWPARPGRFRLAEVLPATCSPARPHALARALSALLGSLTDAGPSRYAAPVLLVGLFGAWLGGPGGAVAAGLTAGLGAHRWHAARLRRRQAGELAALLDALGVMTAELRAGAHPAGAASTAAESVADHAAHPAGVRAPWRVSGSANGATSVRRVLGSIAAGAKLGAEISTLLARHATAEATIGAELTRLGAAWRLAERHGVALADLLDTVRADLDAHSRLASQIGAQLAGPKSTAAVLAVLPVLGVLLGQGIGADPWRVLTDTPVGQLLLVVGTGLTCAGVVWSGRITSGAAPR